MALPDLIPQQGRGYPFPICLDRRFQQKSPLRGFGTKLFALILKRAAHCPHHFVFPVDLGKGENTFKVLVKVAAHRNDM